MNAERRFKHDRTMIVYWGRRGLSRFAFDLADAMEELQPLVSIARTNENSDAFVQRFGDRLVQFDTFATNFGSVLSAWRLIAMRRALAALVQRERVTTLIDVMPHIWMPFLLPMIRRAGVRYIPLLHDAAVHPGDWRTRLAHRAMQSCLRQADHVVALSEAVATPWRVQSGRADPPVTVLFHPDLQFSSVSLQPAYALKHPVRLAFLGRIMPYKGLSLFVDTVTRLRAAGLDVACGVFGEGDLRPEAERLAFLGAEIVNRWLDDDEIGAILARTDLVLASHSEASQSGIVAAALGAGVPVIATPVGGLGEQIAHRETGLLADAVTADALAAAVREMIETDGLYQRMRATIAARQEARSMQRFAAELIRIVAAGKSVHP